VIRFLRLPRLLGFSSAGLPATLLLVAAVAVQPGAQALAVPAANTGSAVAPAVVEAVVDAGMTVGDLDRSVAFFTSVLQFRKVSESAAAGTGFERLEAVPGARARVARLRLGDETIELTQYLEPQGRPVPADSRSHDRWFQHVAIIVSDMDAAYRRLREHRVTHASSGPQTLPGWNRAAAGIRAFYFKDPDGHALEILQFPPGKGEARWQRQDALFLGIDHTAIVVADTDRSLAFYRDALGLRVAGESENYGPEQEHLNAVFGARLRITALRAPRGMGIELLEYLSPSDGRPAPDDARSSDRIHWQTRVAVADVARSAAAALGAGGRQVSRSSAPSPASGVIAAEIPAAMLLSDPDGHALLFTHGGH
jgi:catechol 2,3-dioxygenase-like lactoylglutathione lyase family enzyme